MELKNKRNCKNRNKGKNLVKFPNDYTIIDIETTGLSTEYDEIIELSALKIRNNEIIDKFSTLIKPDYAIDQFITNLTGITNEMVKNAPKINKILDKYLNFIGSDIVIGHNVNFDINFIYDNCLEYYEKEFSNDFIDTHRISKKACSIERHRLNDVAEYYRIDATGHHRAENDCLMTNAIYQAMKNEILSKYGSAEEFYKQNWYHGYQNNIAKNITTQKTNFDEDNFFYNKFCAFTGSLTIQRKDAMQKVVDLGGKVTDNLTQETNILIIGTQDYSKTKENGKSNKMIKAAKYILKGQDLQIISETEFFELINEAEAMPV